MINYITYHHFKHHFISNINWLSSNKSKWSDVLKEIKTLGASQLDYYIGNISVENIERQISDSLRCCNITDKNEYEAWIKTNNGFREIQISDGSLWTLRLIDKDKYIHIHPSRYSVNTIRIKANTLKTVLCTLNFEEVSTFDFSAELVNTYRCKYLELSPLSLSACHNEMEAAFHLFKNKIAGLSQNSLD